MMSRIQLSCYCLIASAFILGAMLMFQVSDHIENKAYGEMVIARQNLSMLSTKVDRQKEHLWVLDSRNEVLLVYSLDVNKNNFELMDSVSLRAILNRAQAGGKVGDRSTIRRPR